MVILRWRPRWVEVVQIEAVGERKSTNGLNLDYP
jgi:hypothetical protein